MSDRRHGPLRRLAIIISVCLFAATAVSAHAARTKQATRTTEASLIVSSAIRGEMMHVTLESGTTIAAPQRNVHIIDRRGQGKATPGDTLQAGQAALVRVVSRDGRVKRVRVILFDSLAEAERGLARQQQRRQKRQRSQ